MSHVLAVDLCSHPLSSPEFVGPVAAALARSGAEVRAVPLSRLTRRAAEGARGLVLCGTPLRDHAWQGRAPGLSWLAELDAPVLGICAGAQLLSTVSGGGTFPWPLIGMREVRLRARHPVLGGPRAFQAWHLHELGASLPPGWTLLAGTAERPEAFAHPERPLAGVLFHPEVRNEWLLDSFAGLCLGRGERGLGRREE